MVAKANTPSPEEKERMVIGRVIQIQGTVLARHNGVERQLQIKSPVFLNDRLSTREKSRVQILLDDGSVISQGEKGELVLDEYAYTPKEKEKTKCSFRLIKGFFRVITGKITDLAPERFTVRSNMATIGIRGCDLGFDIRDGMEDIYIFYLPDNRSVVIQSVAGMMLLKEHGVAVLLTKGEQPGKRKISGMERFNFMQEIVPDTGQSTSGTESGVSKIGTDVIGGMLIMSLLSGADEDHKNRDANDTVNALQEIAEQSAASQTSGGGHHVSRRALLEGGDSAVNDWEWALWNDMTVTYGANQKAGASFLTQAEFQDIARGEISYSLAGQGTAGAILYNSRGDKQTVNGICQIQVIIGGMEVNPSWNGMFDMASGNNALSFTVENGTFDTAGYMVLARPLELSSYTMKLNGIVYSASTLSSAKLEGQLIKPGLGPSPISAVSGEFEFQHGKKAGARGAFGADLRSGTQYVNR